MANMSKLTSGESKRGHLIENLMTADYWQATFGIQ